MSHTTVRLIGVLVVLLLVVGAIVGPATASPGDDTTALGGPVVHQEDGTPTTPENNSTHHENPDEVNEDGDIDQVRGWLNSRLAAQLSQSTLQLSQAEYEQARGVIGDDYNDLLSKYVDVAGDTAGGEDDATAAEFDEAQDEQAAYVSAVEDYRQTREAYLEAKASGNEARARELARNLSETATRIQQLNSSLLESYQAIETQTGVRLDEEKAVIQNITRNITAQQQEITEAEFVTTRLSVQTDQESMSFTDPLRIEGTVTTANGTPVANQTAVIALADRRYVVELDAHGTFTLTYRPVRLPVDTDSMRVRYLPPTQSQYLGSNTTLPITVTQTTPDVDLSLNTTRVAYGDVVRVTGRVGAADHGVPNLPVSLRLASQSATTTRTGSAGYYSQLVRIGPGLQPGTQTVTVRTGFADRAIGPANASTQLQVVETPTTLNITATVQGDTVVLEGQLVTGDGRPVPDQSIELTFADQHALSVTTADTGRFRAEVGTARFDPGATIPITATYDGTSTNLESAQADTEIQIPAGSGAGPVQWLLHPANRLPMGIALLGLLLAVSGGWLLYRRRQTRSTAPQAGATESTESADAVTRSDPTGSVGHAISAARARQREGAAGTAVERVYPAVRQYLTARFDLPETGTHWEFYHAVVDDPATEAWTPVVRALTEAYEQVRYAETELDTGTVDAVLDGLEEQLEARATGAS